MPELHIERIYKLRNFPSVDIRVVIASTEGAVLGRAQTGGVMQITIAAPKAVMITAGVHALRMLEEIGKKFEQQVEHVEYADRVPSVQVPLSFRPIEWRR